MTDAKRLAEVAAILDTDPELAAGGMLRLVVNAWPYLSNAVRVQIIDLALSPEFRAAATAQVAADKEEEALVEQFRQLDPEQQAEYIAYLRRLAQDEQP